MKLADHDSRHDSACREERHGRIRRVKQFLRPLPRKATLHRWPILKWFAKTARKRPYLWSFRPRDVSLSIYFGCIIAFLPVMGFQFAIALAVALLLRANLPIIMGLQLITNLVTMVPIYAVTGLVGRTLIDLWGMKEVNSSFGKITYDLTIGGIFVGLLVGLILDLIYRLVVGRADRAKRVNVKRMLKN